MMSWGPVLSNTTPIVPPGKSFELLPAGDMSNTAMRVDASTTVDEHALYILRVREAHQRQVQALKTEVASLKAALEKSNLAQDVELQAAHGAAELKDVGREASEKKVTPLEHVAARKASREIRFEKEDEKEFDNTGGQGNFEASFPRGISPLSDDPFPCPPSRSYDSEGFTFTNENVKLTAQGKHAMNYVTKTLSPNHASKIRRSGTGKFVMSHSVIFQNEDLWMQRWELFVGILIFLNAVYLGWQTEAMAAHQPPSDEAIRVVAIFFAGAFSLDLVLRIAAQRKDFFTGDDREFNLFDIVIVASMCLDLLGLNEIPSVSILRTVRIFRLLRIVRVIRVFRFFREFRLIIVSLAAAGRAMFWIMCFGVLMLYMAGLGLTDACRRHCYDGNTDDLACRYFGNLGSSMLTLYEVVTCGLLWGEVLEALAPVDIVSRAMFLMFVSLSVLLILNISAALVFDVVQRVSHHDREGIINDELMHKERYTKIMRNLFSEIDANHSGAISLDELEIACGDDRMEALLSALKLEVLDMEQLFRLLDVDNTNAVDIEEFILGCQRLKGEARTIDIVSIQREIKQLLHYVLELRKQIMPPVSSLEQPGQLVDSTQQEIRVTDTKTDDTKSLSVKSWSSSRSTSSFVGGSQIKKAEERSMLLGELQEVCEVINRRCVSEKWTNASTGELLEPQSVDLYQFNYHFMCPQTTPDNITLLGLQPAKYFIGDIVTQVDDWSRADGVVVEDSDDGNLRVAVTRGRFESIELGRARPIIVGNVQRGVPEKVLAPGAISYKELISRVPLKPRWYCSHWWGERIFEFVMCCEQHAARRRMKPATASYWVCGYANRQYDLSDDVCADIKSTAFYKAIGLSEGVLLILDDKAMPFKRIWCDFEIYQSLQTDSKKLLDIVTFTRDEANQGGVPLMLSDGPLPKETAREKTKRESKFPLEILARGIQAKLESGSASVENDRTSILNYITKGSKDPEALQHANFSLNSFFARAAWPQALKKNLVRDFDASQPGVISLPQVLAKDVELKSCILSLEHMDEVSDLEMASLAEGLPPDLRELILSFEGCVHITELGLQALAEALPKKLEVLKLDFLGCRQMRDAGLEVLAEAFPRSLHTIWLHFDKCERVSIRSIKALAEHVPPAAQFKGTFKGTGVDHNFASFAQLKRAANRNNSRAYL